jgi:hypothetical protein
MRHNLEPNVAKTTTQGRALYVAADDRLYISRGYQILCSKDLGQTWEMDCFVPATGWKPYCSGLRLTARLLRWYIAALQICPDGSRLAIARDGIYRAAAGEQRMSRTFGISRGSRPLNLTVDGNRVLFGEYGSGLEDSEVLIYISEDCGQTFHEGFRFPRADIRHVHNILVDPASAEYWVLAGDFGHQPGIGVLDRDLKHLEWSGRGTQRYRAVSAFVDGDSLTYGTDSDRDYNFIVRLDKRSGRIDELLPVEGSSLYSAQFGQTRLISTAVEPNPYCRSDECSLYSSQDGQNWKRLIVHQKDRLNPRYFQFGTLVLPYTEHISTEGFMYSGQAVKQIDNQVSIVGMRQPSTQSAYAA